MKRIIICLIALISIVVVTGCGKTNDLVGTWKGETNDGLKTTFTFTKGNDVKYENEYGIKSEGTYEIEDDIVTINLKSWNEDKKYKFEIKDKKLTLTAQDKYSPSYTDMIKK